MLTRIDTQAEDLIPLIRDEPKKSALLAQGAFSFPALHTWLSARLLASAVVQVEAIRIHHLVPGIDEVVHELLLCVVLGVHLSQRAQL